MAISQSFAALVASHLGADAGRVRAYLAKWAPHENTQAAFNPLATTQSAAGATQFNSAGVKNYPDEAAGARATAETIANGRYPSILRYLRTGEFDQQGVQGDFNVWVTGSRAGTGSAYMVGPVDAGIYDDISSRGGAQVPPEEENPWAQTHDGEKKRIWQTIVNMTKPGGGPQQADYQIQSPDGTSVLDDESYKQALIAHRALLDDAIKWYQTLQKEEMGFVTIGDEVIPASTASPEVMAAARRANEQKKADLYNRLGLSAYATQRTYTGDLNDVEQTNFDNAIKRANAGVAMDNSRTARAAQDISRSLQGLGESRDRAKLISEETRLAAPYATTPGKTGYSAEDLGAMAVQYARFLGLPLGQPLINYPTTVTIDPEASMNQFDERFGVTGPLPSIPEPITSPSWLPQSAPSLSAPPLPPPQYTAEDFAPPPLPPAAPATAVGPSQEVEDILWRLRAAGILP